MLTAVRGPRVRGPHVSFDCIVPRIAIIAFKRIVLWPISKVIVIFIKYRISDKLYAGAGPVVGVKIHEEGDGFRNFALSGQAGLEFMITEEIFIDARYTYGFTNLLDEITGYEAKNMNIQFGIGYKM